MLISYAQNNEDILLMRAFQHIEGGTYIDIGTNDPVKNSVSLAFYQRGWRGVHVGPNASFAERLTIARPDEKVHCAAIRAIPEPLSLSNVEGAGLSIRDTGNAKQHVRDGFPVSVAVVESKTLDWVFEDFVDRNLHWLRIAVEGMERDLLSSWVSSSVRPWIIVIESVTPNSPASQHLEWEELVLEKGYEYVFFDGINRFYISENHPELKGSFKAPVSYFDGLSVSEQSIFACRPLVQLREIKQEASGSLGESTDIEGRLGLEARRNIERSKDAADNAAELAAAKSNLEALEVRVATLSEQRDAIQNSLKKRAQQLEQAKLEASQKSLVKKDISQQVLDLGSVLKAAKAEKGLAWEKSANYTSQVSQETIELSKALADVKEDHRAIMRALDFAYERLRESQKSLLTTPQNSDFKTENSKSLEQDTVFLSRKVDELERVHTLLWQQKAIAAREHELAMRMVHEANMRIESIKNSLSWKLMAPLRLLITAVRLLIRGTIAWGTLRPGSRPRRIARHILASTAKILSRRTAGKRLAKWMLRPFPKLRSRLEAIIIGHMTAENAPRLKHDTTISIQTRPILAITRPEAKKFPIYVYVDQTISCATNTGVQRVVRGLCNELLDLGHKVYFIKWNSSEHKCELINQTERAYLGHWNGPPVSEEVLALYPRPDEPTVAVRPALAAGQLVICPEVTHADQQGNSVTSQLINWAHRLGYKIGFIFYDAIPLKRPEFSSSVPIHSQYMRDLRFCDVIWPISRWSASELAAFWGIDRDADNSHLPKIRPVHLPAAFGFSRLQDTSGSESLILCVGTVEPRKNQVALVHAFDRICREHPSLDWRLVLVGNLHPLVSQSITEAILKNPRISFLGHVSDAELSELYQKCAFTVFPSEEEGFGLPILESLWHARPCMTANFGAMDEIADGGGCFTFDVRNADEFYGSVLRMITDPDLRLKLAEEAVNRPMIPWSGYVDKLNLDSTDSDPLIYFWVDTTVTFPANTGIQRVARQLARALIEAGYALIPVKWGGASQPFHSVSEAELAHFSQWNGPKVASWHAWVSPHAQESGGWFLMTELPLNLTNEQQVLVRTTAQQCGLLTGAVFYDTIPWKMRSIYPEPFWRAHRLYMREMANYSSVMAISDYSRQELLHFLEAEFQLDPRAQHQIQAVPLAGEFALARLGGREINRDDKAVIKLICVGTVEPRKNHEKLLDAFELAQSLSTRPLKLTIVGGGHSIEPDLAVRVRARVDRNSAIEWEETADDDRIDVLQRECDFAIYPSVEEGFGLPILESLSYGKPVICANFGAMLEVAADGGGCVMVDVREAYQMAAAIARLANSDDELETLAQQARHRRFKNWGEYAQEVASKLGLWNLPPSTDVQARRSAMGLNVVPKLSVCISTYNRAEWLTVALRNLVTHYPNVMEGVEFVICDNASTDKTEEVVRPYLARPDFVYRRNAVNVGMLGNLEKTALASKGEYIWILGDDDLLMPGAIERVLAAIEKNPGVSLVYLSYAFTHVDDARTVTDVKKFFAEATPIVPPEPDLIGPIKDICARNENFFTAIYTLVFRRNHGLAAYSQDTSGRPFSTMLTCIPTTHYVLHNMMDEPGVWIGEPQVVVNMNVSWIRYAPLWILERIPEVYEIACAKGVSKDDMDRWRKHTLKVVVHYFNELYTNDPYNNAEFFSAARLVNRFSDLAEFSDHKIRLLEIYSAAHKSGHPAAIEPPSSVFN